MSRKVPAWLPLVLMSPLLSCNTLPYDLVSMYPIYGWVDGCTDLVISGHGFGADATVTLGGVAIEGLSLPVEDSVNWGYQIYGRTVPTAEGYADLVVTTGGVTETLTQAYWFTACPSSPNPESVEPSSEITVGSPVTLSGCNLDGVGYVVVGNSKVHSELSPLCSTAQSTMLAPEMPEGTWCLAVFDTKGIQVSPPLECDTTVPDCSSPEPMESGDTAAYDPCSSALRLTYGGAR